MAITHDAASAASDVASNADFTHTPSGTPSGAVVGIIQTGAISDQVTSVAYGAAAMTRVGTVSLDAAEDGRLHLYHVHGVAAGAQTVDFTTGAQPKRALCWTYISSNPVEVLAVPSATDGVGSANPSLAITISAGRAALTYYALWSGFATASSTVQSGMTHDGSHGFGAQSGMWAHRAHTGPSTMGYTLSSDEWAHIAVALGEVVPPSTGVLKLGRRRGVGLHGGLTVGR